MSATQNWINQRSLTGLETPLGDDEQQFLDNIHRFARDVMRPAGIELDRMPAEHRIAPGSPYWQVLQGFGQLGINYAGLAEFEPLQRARITALLLEELGWGDGGLGISLGAAMTPVAVAQQTGNEWIQKNLPEDAIGCWGITEPDHGSDMLNYKGYLAYPGADMRHANCIAKIREKEIVVNGQKAAWVSNGPVATHCALFCAADYGDDKGGRVIVIVPLDAPGVSRGKNLEKVGQRALPQGEIYFDNVSISKDWLAASREDYDEAFYHHLSEANTGTGNFFVGVARAAFELALDYAHTRKQGGVPIFKHQDVRRRLFDMFRRVEAARALTRRVWDYSLTAKEPALEGAIASKVFATQTAAEITTEALNLFGGNGITPEYPIEKMFRDAAISTIEDGANAILSIIGGSLLGDPEQF